MALTVTSTVEALPDSPSILAPPNTPTKSLTWTKTASDAPAGSSSAHATTYPATDIGHVLDEKLAPKSPSIRLRGPVAARKYNMSELLQIGAYCVDNAIMLKVKPEAIQQNLFQYLGMNRFPGIARRSRPFARLSGRDRSSTLSSLTVADPNANYLFPPSRQPRPPPESAAAQQHDGFIQFLKEHASPPHNRVTAGGRIVPNGPSGPPPMFDYASLTAAMHGNGDSSRAFASMKTDRYNQLGSKQFLAASLSQNAGHIYGQPPSSPQTMQQPGGMNGVQWLAPPMQVNQVIPMGHLADGTALVVYNGLCCRATWNGEQILLEPLQVNLANASITDIHRPVGPTPQSLGPSLDQPASAAGSNAARNKRDFASLPTSSDSEEPLDERFLRAELSELNSHLAFHHYKIRPSERTALITKRRALVEQIDKIRVPKAPTTVSMPLARTFQSTADPVGEAPVTRQTDLEGRQSIRIRSEASRKGLSPNAPTFVPGQHEASSMGKSHQSQTAMPAVTQPPQTSLANSKTPIRGIRQFSSSTDRSNQCSPVDARDPAMRVIQNDDIKYVQDYGLTGKGRHFCTTVAQFQEAIRRVREQARQYGCDGGSSKDPAYDAEQDIWWAIKDETPIPLPTDVPDHIAYPRPWNWNNSAFNHQAPRLSLGASESLAATAYEDRTSGPQSTQHNKASNAGPFDTSQPHHEGCAGPDANLSESSKYLRDKSMLFPFYEHGSMHGGLHPGQVNPARTRLGSGSSLWAPRRKNANGGAFYQRENSMDLSTHHSRQGCAEVGSSGGGPPNLHTAAGHFPSLEPHGSLGPDATSLAFPSSVNQIGTEISLYAKSTTAFTPESTIVNAFRADPRAIQIPKETKSAMADNINKIVAPFQHSSKEALNSPDIAHGAVLKERVNQQTCSESKASTPVVNLPHNVTGTIAPLTELTSRQKENTSSKILQEMLRSSRFISTVTGLLRKDTSTKSAALGDALVDDPPAQRDEKTLDAQQKSSSSLASSTLQAIAQLPASDGSSRAHGLILRQHETSPTPPHPVVSLPAVRTQKQKLEVEHMSSLAVSYKREQDVLAAKSTPLFGFDGVLDEQDKAKASQTTGSETAKAQFDPMGVTKADFDTRRPDHRNPEHQAAVEEFFRDLHKREMSQLKALRRKNSKTT